MGFIERYFNIIEIDAMVKNSVFAGNPALSLVHHQEQETKEFLNMVKIVKSKYELELFFLFK